MSDLEQKIHALRTELDQQSNPDMAGLWQRIENQRQRQRNSMRWLQLAAGLIILVSIAAGVWWSNVHQQAGAPPPSLPPEAQQFVQDYETEIHQKLNQIDAKKIDSSAWEEIQLELHLLENYGKDIRQDMNLYDQNQIMELLKRYYERKIRLIELLQKEMQNTEKKPDHYES